ncbi:ABC transporter substrate-binding protein [Pseudobacteroides cellulosolvens]|uniref:ABC-type transporter, periplasmic subunit n=1 Tax=Pseudobacteroides cellulosolvens ATCC 35603 = DSM 2933 TaxID=398512 RepID=A0A0L6JV83_9FIRM|nr:ABC transporter substrate-binding protein [Pseudobacteroides cellulosolvens]KNY29337.1 ABC-type transporter, periplasmic subunit [Pseudobacteroides cellulosolvens ATCC 35603 = DSM 2933]
MFKKRLLILISIIILAFSIVGCTESQSPENSEKPTNTMANAPVYPLKIKDSYDREIKIDSEPQRIISIAPNITEIIYAIGKSSKLTGRSEYCDYPEDVKKVTSVGSLQDPSIEKIVELKPDLVLVSTHFKKEIVQKLESMGINIAAFYGDENFEGVYSTIEKVGAVLNSKDNANKLITDMKVKVQNVADKVKDKPCPSVYYVVSYGKMGDFTAGKDTFIGQMIQMAGGKNAADDAQGWSYSLEKLVEKNPEILICSKFLNSKQGIESTNGYKDLSAVKNKKLYEVDNNMLDRQGPRLADGLTELAKIIHPEAFK